MNEEAMEILRKQLENMQMVELKGVARNLKEKKSFKFSTLKKGELIQTILDYIDFKPMIYPKQEKFKFKIPKTENDIFYRLNELAYIVSQKRLQKIEYICLRKELEKYNF